METVDDIPQYPLWAILNMNESYFPVFSKFFDITDTKDVRGQIVVHLGKINKLTYPKSGLINNSNIQTLMQASLPKAYETTDPTWGTVDRYQRMLYHLTVAEFQDFRDITPLSRTVSSYGDFTERIHDRHLFFEIDREGNPVYIGDGDGPYESALHNNIEKCIDHDGQLYLLYGMVTPDLVKQIEIVKMLNRSIGWMPDVRNKGWTMVLRQMIDYLRQEPMPFVGLLSIDEGIITQVNGETILYGNHLDPEDLMIQTDVETLESASTSGAIIEDHFGNSGRNEGIWFEIPILATTSPRISMAGLRCSDDNEIIGTAKFRCIQLPKSDKLKLPKLKINTLFM